MADILSLDNILIHIVPAIAAGGAAWAGVKSAIKSHSEKISRLEKVGSWHSRKITQLAVHHNTLHPNHEVVIDDYPDNGGSARP